jgi:hypothetical protein
MQLRYCAVGKRQRLSSRRWLTLLSKEGDLQDEVHSAANIVIHIVDHCNFISDPNGFPSTTLSVFVALGEQPYHSVGNICVLMVHQSRYSFSADSFPA